MTNTAATAHYLFTATASTDGWGEEVHSYRCACGWGSVVLRDIERVSEAFEIHLKGAKLRAARSRIAI